MAIRFCGHALELYAERALYWPTQSSLMLADLHLGKGDAFRRAGLAVPSGGTALDLSRLRALIQHTGAQRVCVLGDLLHGPLPSQAGWRQQWDAFLADHADIAFEAVLGNHDRALHGQSDFGRLRLLQEGHCMDGLLLRHHPPEPDDARPTLFGHLHPVLRLRQQGLPPRLPAFWQRATQLALPAFSAFTGGWPITLQPGDRVWACTPAGVWALPQG
ncbi:MAG: ligase-associated DNA damage response endonuclease PdeM [Aquimonas sp.]|nr:ligase-associated DNA damage response endonuclease PdeM [Aquimonas sp.]